eukprot:TRINITY_DN8780_c0_g1_i1.p1 TRINITY_DN8780_c0_g1~~TRINITY_DN8780_c0_g1_i1.p1  ORF type:complete len:862 (-),score=242.51 TRINITY_DN8780_c0_g1_i1:109-2694(-)
MEEGEGKEKGMRIYVLKYSISPIYFSYRFALNQVYCVHSSERNGFGLPSFGKENLYASVEFNDSPHQLQNPPISTYDLGHYTSQEVGPIHTCHNLNFSAITNFKIRFFIKKAFNSQLELGCLRFVPLTEVFKAKKKWEENAERESKESGLEDPLEGILLVREGESTDWEEGDVTHELLVQGDSFVVKKIIMTSKSENAGNVSSYEFVFTLTKEIHHSRLSLLPSSAIQNKLQLQQQQQQQKLLDFITEKDLPWVIASGKNAEKKQKILQNRGGNPNTNESIINNKKLKGELSHNNNIELLIDGEETFQRYFEVLSSSQHSIKILAWDMSLSFGLIRAENAINHFPKTMDSSQKWITLEDVLLDRALDGVKVQIIVWRHNILNYLERLLHREASIETQVSNLEKRYHKLGLTIKVFRLMRDNMPNPHSPFANPTEAASLADISVVIVGSPKGIYLASHHEKLVLVDSECSEHSLAFVGGYDVARGRYDNPSHQIPDAISPLHSFDGASSILGTRLLWHDLQFLIRGSVTDALSLHFTQRWIHAFTRDTIVTRKQTVTIPQNENCKRGGPVALKNSFPNSSIRVLRVWKGVFDTQYLFREFTEMITNAKEFIYLEHQYPFHNFPLTHFMCQALQNNPNLLVVIVAPVKTDLLSGFVGNLVDWSEDHIMQHLLAIKKAAPDRVGIYGLVQQDENSSRVKPIYIHSKIAIIDDEWILSGSSNMDNMSFFYSSELTFSILNPELAVNTRSRLFQEHLGRFWKPEMESNFPMAFDAFQQVAMMNDKCLRASVALIGRPVCLVPTPQYQLVLERIFYPNKFSKLLFKLGINTEDLIQNISETLSITPSVPNPNSRPWSHYFPFLKSNL